MNYSDVKEYWNNRAMVEGEDANFTLPDYNLRTVEAQYIIRHLYPEAIVLDIGCGNGTTTKLFAEKVNKIVGGDYSSTMIEKAIKLHFANNIEYKVLDVTNLDIADSSFDIVITERCLINMQDWASQQKAISEIARVLKPGGKALLLESFEDAMIRFADLRNQFGLQPMKRHENNFLIREDIFKDYVKDLFEIESVEKMGLFYLISRIVHPLMVKPNDPQYDASINRVAIDITLKMPSNVFEEYSVNGLYVLKKRVSL